MTFNRYILFRMVVEFVGAIACAIQMFQHHTWPGIITMGRVRAGVGHRRDLAEHGVQPRAPPPRRAVRRASGDGHPFHVLRACGGAGWCWASRGMIVTLFRHAPFTVPAMALPTLGMLALAIADARYLWLEHEGGDTDED